ncbi:hypothetical protein ACHAW5_009092 [Stephanodiscus triporus]|uniref:Anaphase-promoting complex subunit 1 n=1 Tax=Stephanodiscus triporus TaxID=2934178 RepID=A0ABD3QKF9_9STRA
MAPERRLIPPDHDARCTSNVVGVIPPKVRDFLAAVASASGARDDRDGDEIPARRRRPPPPPPTRRGRVDDHSSGASFLLGRDDDNDNDEVVVVWEHSAQTPNEELIAPTSGVYARLVHPEQHRPDDDLAGRRDLLVACLGPDPDDDDDDDDDLAAVRGGGGGDRRLRSRRARGGGHTHSSSSPRRAYVVSPSTGVLCLWILDDDHDYDYDNDDDNDHRARTRGGAAKATGGGGGGDCARTTTKECDASVRLRLRDGECLTALVPIDVANNDDDVVPGRRRRRGRRLRSSDPWLLASTNRGRVWKVRTTYRPMTLHARLVGVGAIGGGGDATAFVVPATTTKAVGVVRGLYNYLTTPSKTRDGGGGGDDGNATSRTGGPDDEYDADDADDDDIVALVPFPRTTTTMTTNVVASSSSSSSRGDEGGRKSPGRGPAGTAPPRKQQRLHPSSSRVDVPPKNSLARFVSVTSSMALTEWIVSTSDDDEVDGVARREGRASRTTRPFPRRRDGTLDLSALLPPPPRLEDDDDDASAAAAATGGGEGMEADPLVGYRRLDVLAPPVIAGDGASMLFVIRVARDDDDDDDDDVDGSATRAYVVRIGLVPGGAPYYVVDAAWLDRHSGPSLSNSDGLACVGLAVAEEEEDEGGTVGPGDDDDDDDDDGAIVVGGSVAYVGFGPRGDRGGAGGGEGGGRQFPVTVSAIHFPRVGVATTRERRRQPRVKDLDLHSSIVPAVVRDSMSYDPLTGGCVFLATTGLLCGAHVRFPIVARRRPASSSSAYGPPNDLLRPMSSLLLLAQDEAVLTIKSHLQSSFRQYLIKLKEGGGCGGNSARAVVAPSVGTCPSRVLSAAVVLASNDYACAPGGAAFSSGIAKIGGGSPVTALRDKLRLHRDFVTFLVHAGAYRRVSTAGRVRLRDHGELMTATRAMLIECQGHFSKAEAAIGRGGGGGRGEGDTGRRIELARARQMVMSALEGASDDVTALPHRWAGLQQLAYSSGNSPLFGNGIFLLLTSASICEGIGQALRYRQNESGPLYDIPSYDSSSSTSTNNLPWTSICPRPLFPGIVTLYRVKSPTKTLH